MIAKELIKKRIKDKEKELKAETDPERAAILLRIIDKLRELVK